MSTIHVGVDPGKGGAIAFHVGGRWLVHDCPLVETSTKTRTNKKTGKKIVTVKKESSPILMATLFRDVLEKEGRSNPKFVVHVEKVSAMPGQGVTSMFSFGRNFGQWEGVIAALGCEVHYVTPQRWKKTMLAGQPKGKEAARMRALQLFPYLVDALKRKKDDGRAEALLIGEYGRGVESV
jgi:crossover junction endodeoxyribonuclease RuvC